MVSQLSAAQILSRRRATRLVAFAPVAGWGWGLAAVEPKASADAVREIALGDARVDLHLRVRGQGGLSFVSVHENETTSVRAAQDMLVNVPGRLLTLHQSGARLVKFRLEGKRYSFDPNRIFTERGLAATLRRYGADSPAAREAVRLLRDALIALLPSDAQRPIVALHNNTQGQYSMADYLPGGPLADDAASVHRQDVDNDDDFFLVTRRELFDGLAAEGFNCVLQAERARDDGSMSIWAQREGRPYINVEALHGRRREQHRMLAAVQRRFGAGR